jgi:FKBP-type peptidyl-prolyl cis-trans isomerase (trigger factor)
MSRTSVDPKAETITFRIPAALKAALAEIADEEAKPVGELLRELVSDRVRRQRRRAFEAEARRQSLAAAAAAADPNSDDAAVQRELDSIFDEFAREWK